MGSDDQNEPFRLLFEDNPCALLVYSPETQRVLTINRALARLTGLHPDDTSGYSLGEVVERKTMSTLSDILSTFDHQYGAIPLTRRWSFRHPDGRSLELEATSQQTIWQGRPARIVVIEDVTEREKNRAMLESYQEHLEMLVEQRTAALTAAKQDAESANHAKSVFLSNMSHELRTPLNAVLGFARILERDPALRPEQLDKVARIGHAGQSLLNLINDVLEISRIEAGEDRNPCETFSLTDLLNNVDETFQPRARDKSLDFAVDTDAPLPIFVKGNFQRLRQVLFNLLGNAFKYTEAGQVKLRVNASNGSIRFAVSDTGPGIAPAERKHIFQAFYQTATGVAHGEGTGLGLHLSHEYARLMGGQLRLEERPDWSTVFVLEVPLPAAETPSANNAPQRIVGLQAGQDEFRLLLVDDQEDNRWLAGQLLESAGFTVRTAENGEQAITVFQDWQPHLIWMDMRMPVMDGYEATRRIRAMPGGDIVRIAAMTGNTLAEEHLHIRAAGCDAIVTKPLEENEVFTVIRDLLGVRYRYAEDPEHAPATEFGDPDLSLLSAEQRQQLAQAAERLDIECCRQIAEQLPAHARPPLAVLIEQFRFEHIRQLCG